MDVKQLYFDHINNDIDLSSLYEEYTVLDVNDINELIDIVILDNAPIEVKIDVFLYLALFSYSCGDKLPLKMYNYLLDNEIYYYGQIYLRADEVVLVRLIEALEKDNGPKADKLLSAISAIPCEKTKDFLIKNSKNPLPIWAKKLHILPIAYSQVSGWDIDTKENIVKLYSDSITVFEGCEKEKSSSLSPLKSIDECCAYCHRHLTLIFDIKQKLATCLDCSLYENIYIKQDNDKIYWHEKNIYHDFSEADIYDISEQFEYGLRKTNEHRKSTFVASQFVEISRTQIGGIPTPINDINYPKCLECGETMKFVAQFYMGDVDEYGDGIYYFFSCEKCNVHVSNYDQT